MSQKTGKTELDWTEVSNERTSQNAWKKLLWKTHGEIKIQQIIYEMVSKQTEQKRNPKKNVKNERNRRRKNQIERGESWSDWLYSYKPFKKKCAMILIKKRKHKTKNNCIKLIKLKNFRLFNFSVRFFFFGLDFSPVIFRIAEKC